MLTVGRANSWAKNLGSFIKEYDWTSEPIKESDWNSKPMKEYDWPSEPMKESDWP